MHDIFPESGVTRLQTLSSPDLSGDSGSAMYDLVSELYPICRSITGEGVRKTLKAVARYIPLMAAELPSGLEVLDWTVPMEWEIRDAYVKNAAGERVIDFRRSNLHVVSYSLPVHRRMNLEELRPHLHSDPDHADAIPYRTSYYSPAWGFCLSHNQLLSLPDSEYEVCIDATLAPGHLTYGELLLVGQSTEEVIVSCHVCHPSLCNDNLSGIAIATALAQHLSRRNLRYSYRFLFIPGTIGSIAWLALNQGQVGKIKHGFVLSCVGDVGHPTYKQSRRGDAEIDRTWQYVLSQDGGDFEVRPFSPYGYDERQFCSPGFDLPVGCFMRTPHGEYPEYHTSADDLSIVQPSSLKDSLTKALIAIDVIENNRRYVNLKPYGEPKLGKYGLYNYIGGNSAGSYQMALLWLLNMSDGKNSILDIATRSNLPWEAVKQGLRALCAAGLLKPAD